MQPILKSKCCNYRVATEYARPGCTHSVTIEGVVDDYKSWYVCSKCSSPCSLSDTSTLTLKEAVKERMTGNQGKLARLYD
jgi:hypothetical protein